MFSDKKIRYIVVVQTES